ncbi:MAG: bis(5'-nucleosyl)-tetraphosphatase (symmetrical) YqeK [Thermotogota bacterium]|nr:bis(5'-nucleosyl)-tetraphosphatase (symmetrical) YqeK [Thermotogota bacterium]
MKSDMIVEEIIVRIKKNLNPKRLEHTMGVLDYSILLAEKHGEEILPVKIGALYHDAYRNHKNGELIEMAKKHQLHITKEEKYNPILLHGKLAANDLKKRYPTLLRIDEIAQAIEYHTSGYVFNSKIGKIIFIADSLEKNRIYPGVEELRKLSIEDLNTAFFLILKGKVRLALEKNQLILKETLKAYNRTLMNRESRNDQHS